MKILEPLLTKMGRGAKRVLRIMVIIILYNYNVISEQGATFPTPNSSGDNERTDFTFTPHYFVSKVTLLDLQNRSQNLSNRIYTPALPSTHC